MSIITKTKRVLRKAQKALPVRWLVSYIRIGRGKRLEKKYSDYEYIKCAYKSCAGVEPDFINPKRYSEKLQWLKLFYRDPIMPICSDKYKVREYLEEKGYGYLLNNLIAVYDSAKDINPNELPERFAMKTNHGSNWNLICTNKKKINWFWWRRLFSTWLKRNLYTYGREWNYKEIEPKIIVEEFLEHSPLIDYKFMCFNGEPKYLQINHDIDNKHYVDFYDIEWNKLDFTYKNFHTSNITLPKPLLFDEMKSIATDLCTGFPHVRVDFYSFEKRIIFGEMTFFPSSGMHYPNPVEKDIMLGNELILPEPNHNLELLKQIQNNK